MITLESLLSPTEQPVKETTPKKDAVKCIIESMIRFNKVDEFNTDDISQVSYMGEVGVID
jgi:hypothetical protein